ncbi:MAG TPA: DUF397 domain-containing protein [Pseudonocardiaceae bacterium]|jgi:hypothetical protein|nr:DUF397 domain-containing protein [Pseudonocardiaceae bacterium]
MQPQWRKASYSNASGECIELANFADLTGVRDSKNPNGGQLRFPRFDLFLANLKSGVRS